MIIILLKMYYVLNILISIRVFATQTSPPVRGQCGAPSVYQQAVIDDVIASGQGPKRREAGTEEGDALVVSFSFFCTTLQ